MERRRHPWEIRPSRLEVVARQHELALSSPPRTPDETNTPPSPHHGRVAELALAEITVGERFRADLGDLEGLASSMAELGLLQPIVVTEGLVLIAGGRRLEAARRLGWPTVAAVVAEELDDVADLLRAERDENTCRKEMTIEEKVRLGRAIEQAEGDRARARMLAGGRPCGTSPEGPTGTTRDAVGALIGLSGRTYERAREVITTSEDDEPSNEEVRVIALEALDDLRRTGNVTAAHEKVRAAKGRGKRPLVIVDSPGTVLESALATLERDIGLSPSTVAAFISDIVGIEVRIDRAAAWLGELYDILAKAHGVNKRRLPRASSEPLDATGPTPRHEWRPTVGP
jgi:ParB-like chromosome segregation protein Spo0J